MCADWHGSRPVGGCSVAFDEQPTNALHVEGVESVKNREAWSEKFRKGEVSGDSIQCCARRLV